MNLLWRKSAIQSLMEIDQWRNTIELPPIATYLKDTIHTYFKEQDFTFYIPGRQVIIHNMPVELRMVLIAIGKIPLIKFSTE